MEKTTSIRSRVNPALKRQVDGVLTELGLNISEAITIFFRQIVLQRGLPFEVKMPPPNRETRKAMQDAEKGRGIRYSSTREMFTDLKS